MKPMKEIAQEANTDKLQHNYIDIYDKFFCHARQEEVNFLEIGVHKGNSATLWNGYFEKANIYMCDIFEKTGLLGHVPRVNFLHGDGSNPDNVERFMDTIEEQTGRRELDIIVDDGSHFQYDQMKGIGYWFPYLSKNGIYIIEDICREEALRTGSMWWGDRSEPHHSVMGECHWGSSLRSDEEWLAGPEKNCDHSTDATLKRFGETQIFDSAYLTEEQNKYITDNIGGFHYFTPCSSRLVVIQKGG
jgi:hypothetical protein